MVDGQLVAAGIGCYIPFLKSPYSGLPPVASPSTLLFRSILLAAAVISVVVTSFQQF